MVTQENLLALDDDEIFNRLHAALVGDDSGALAKLARAIDQRWTYVVACRQWSRAETLFVRLFDAARWVSALGQDRGNHDAYTRVGERWRTMAELGEVVLTMTDEVRAVAIEAELTELAALEAELSSFRHARDTLSFLDNQGLAKTGDIAVAISCSVQNTSNHLQRLVERQLVFRVTHGLYRLSPKGREALQLLNKGTAAISDGLASSSVAVVADQPLSPLLSQAAVEPSELSPLRLANHHLESTAGQEPWQFPKGGSHGDRTTQQLH